MHKLVLPALLVVSLLLVSAPAFASLKDIRRERLPDDPAVQKAYVDVSKVEDMVREWHDKWPYGTPKDDVAFVLANSLRQLQQALTSSPENEELLLLTGLVAHYAYNVDVEGSFDAAISALERADKLAPSDYRAQWFLGIHQCQANVIEEGMNRLLSVEQSLPWEKLPIGFWDDYMVCATVANMPAHTLRAGQRAMKLDPSPSRDRDFFIRIARSRYTLPEPTATYTTKEVWQTKSLDSGVVFTNSMFGFAFTSHGEWKLQLPDVKQGWCLVQIQTGPYRGKAGDVFPSILILARQAKPGETLEDFLGAALRHSRHSPSKEIDAPNCPLAACLAHHSVKAGAYDAEGDGHGIATAFESKQPEFPGLLFEEPMGPPKGEGREPKYYHPVERLLRVSGTVYYLVLLDSADSALAKAKSDYEAVLKSMQVE